MSGKRYFLVTNAIIQLLAGNDALVELLSRAQYVATSVICELEFNSFAGLGDEDRDLFEELRQRLRIVDLSSANSELKRRIYALRSTKQLKLPDAIIAASASVEDCVLLTADERMLSIPGVEAESYPVV